jgi:hypothetical protein
MANAELRASNALRADRVAAIEASMSSGPAEAPNNSSNSSEPPKTSSENNDLERKTT